MIKTQKRQFMPVCATGLLAAFLLTAPLPVQADTTFFERRSISFAKRAFQDNLYDVSKIKLEKFLEKYPESDFKTEALWLLAQSHYFLGQTEEALKILKESAPPADDKLAPAYLYWQAETEAAAKQYQPAIRTYRAFLKNYPDHELAAEAILGLSKTLFQSGEQKSAVEVLVPLLSEEQNSTQKLAAQMQQCRIMIGTENYEDALKILAEIQSAGPQGKLLYESSFIEGEIHRLKGDNEKALTAYRRITTDSLAKPRSLVVDAHLASGSILFTQQKWSEASADFEKAFRLALDSAQIQLAVKRYLEAQFKNQTLTKAALEVRNFVNKNPDTAISGLYAIGKYFFMEKKYDAAITELDHLLMNYPDSVWVWPARLTMAEALLEKNQIEEAFAVLNELAENSPRKDVKTRALTLIGENHFSKSAFTKAASAFQQAAESATPEEKEVLMMRTLISQASARDLEGYLATESAFFTAFPQSEFRTELLMEKARLYEKTGKDQEARNLYSELIDNETDPKQTAVALFRLGYSSWQSGEYSDALNAFTALEKDHENFSSIDLALFLKIQCEYLLNVKDSEEVAESLQQWINRFPDSKEQAEVLNYLGTVLENRGQYAEAVAQYRKVVDLFPKTAQADLASYWGGKSLYELTQFKDAIPMLENVRTESEWKPSARLYQIMAYMQLGDYRSALKISNSVLKDNPRDEIKSFARLRQAECLYTLASEDRKLYAKALEAADEVINMESATSPERNEAGFIKGEIFQKLNQSGQALQAYMEVVYGQLLPEENTRLTSQPEIHWFIKSGLAAANIKENQGDVRGAVEIYRILERIGEPSRNEFRRKIEDLKNEYFLYENT